MHYGVSILRHRANPQMAPEPWIQYSFRPVWKRHHHGYGMAILNEPGCQLLGHDPRRRRLWGKHCTDESDLHRLGLIPNDASIRIVRRFRPKKWCRLVTQIQFNGSANVNPRFQSSPYESSTAACVRFRAPTARSRNSTLGL